MRAASSYLLPTNLQRIHYDYRRTKHYTIGTYEGWARRLGCTQVYACVTTESATIFFPNDMVNTILYMGIT